MLAIFGIFLSLILLMVLAYRGITVLILAPALALLVVAFSGEWPLLATYTEVFMKNFAGFAKAFFPLFLLGAIFGKVMEDSGSAQSISRWVSQRLGSRHAIAAIVLSCAILTYGGVSLFVVAFGIFPIAAALFREADIPKRLIPGTIALGSFTFSMTALPGTPQIQNSLPMPYFGTTTFAAPWLGVISSILMCGMGLGWLNWRLRKAREKGEGYGKTSEHAVTESVAKDIPVWKAALPIAVVLLLNLYLLKVYFPSIDSSFLANKPFETSLDKVVGVWSLIISLTAAIVVTLALNFRRMTNKIKSLNEGAFGSLLAIVNTASEVGYGNVIASLTAFVAVKEALLTLSSNPLIAEALSVTTLAGITGSASGGLSIALGALGGTYLEMANAAGISPEVLHRIAVIACGGLDSLPHNGAVITLLAICGLTHRDSYLDIGATTVVIPLITLVFAIGFAMMGVV